MTAAPTATEFETFHQGAGFREPRIVPDRQSRNSRTPERLAPPLGRQTLLGHVALDPGIGRRHVGQTGHTLFDFVQSVRGSVGKGGHDTPARSTRRML